MLTYLAGLLAQVVGVDRQTFAMKWSVATVLASAWASLGAQFQGFWGSPVVQWVTVFWALDWVLGSLLAWREHRYDPRRGLFSTVKWLIWMSALAVCWGFRHDGTPYDDWIPPLLEVGILLTEGASVLRNGAVLQASLSGSKEPSILGRFAGFLDRDLKRRLDALEQQPPEGPDEGPSPVPASAVPDSPGPGTAADPGGAP